MNHSRHAIATPFDATTTRCFGARLLVLLSSPFIDAVAPPEIAGRTEQHWCPIKHATRPLSTHSRYERFVAHGDASVCRDHEKRIRRPFADLQ